MKLLIADDNSQIRDILSKYAKAEGFEVDVACDGYEALAKAEYADCVLLDVMMPKLDGFSVCKEVRKSSSVPIIMVTARGEDYEKIMGLDMGADDYIVKPFSPAEVMARVRAVVRRLEPDKGPQKLSQFGLEIDMEGYQVRLHNQPLKLTKKEIELLYTLMAQPSRVHSRERLLNGVWGYDYYGDARTVDSHITRLRAKLDVHAHPEWSIETVWGVGYKFEIHTP